VRPVNLLPAKYRPRSGGGEDSKAAYIALGVLGALVVAVFLYVSAANQLSSRTSDIAQVRGETQAAQSHAVTLQAYGDFAGTKEARIQAVKSLATIRLDWERLFRELAHVLPARVWLTGFDGVTASGETGASTGTGSEGPGGPTIKLQGCAASYSSVADVMVRLRELHGATDVVLSKTAKAASGGAAAGAAAVPAAPAAPSSSASGGADCGPYNSFDIDVTLSQESGDLAGEPAEVPASLGGGG
jgi:Tfp pilus assembly protein PilN